MSKTECAELSTANFTIMDLANENDSSMCYDIVQNFDTEAIVSPIPEMPQKPLAKKKNKQQEGRDPEESDGNVSRLHSVSHSCYLMGGSTSFWMFDLDVLIGTVIDKQCDI